MEYCGAVYSFHAERDIKTGRAAPQTLHAVVNGAENDTANGSPGYRENSGPAAGTQSANIDSNAAAPSMKNIRSAEGKSQGKSSGRAQEKSSGRASTQVESREYAELRREYERRAKAWNEANDRNDESFPFASELRWITDAEKRLNEMKEAGATRKRRMSAEERKNTPPDLGDADTVFADGSISALSEERKITPETSEEARYEILKDRTIRPASVEYDKLGDTDTAAIYDGLSAAQMAQAKKAIRAIAKKLGLNQVDLKNSRIEFPFRFSNANAGVSAQHQSEYGGSYQDLVKALTCLPTIVENAELIETHTEKKRGTKKENPDLKQVYVLLGAMKDGESIIPIQMEVKEFKNANGGLYMTVAMTKIKESDVVKKLQAGESAAATSLLSDSSISIQDILRNVKAEDGRFLKYAPDAFLNDEQKAAKRRAIQRQTEEYASYKIDGNGRASVEVENRNTKTSEEDARRDFSRASRLESTLPRIAFAASRTR